MSSSFALLGIVHALSNLVNIGCSIALLLVVTGPVRRHRPDAWRGLLAWAIGALVVSILSPAFYSVGLPLAARLGGSDALVATQSIIAIVMTGLHVAIVVLLARSLIQIAQPPKPVTVDSGAAYR